MTIKDLPLDQKIRFMDRFILCLDYWRENAESYENGDMPSYEYQRDIYWYWAHGIREALGVLYGSSAELDKFMTNFTAIIDDGDTLGYDIEEMCNLLREAFGVTAEEYDISRD